MANFEIAYEKTLAAEGGYKLHTVKGDRGGMTFAGISRNIWSGWPGWALIDAGETSSERLKLYAKTFLNAFFWNKIYGDQIGFQGVADAIYDFAVNSGLSPAVKRVQHIVGTVQDGVFGPKTFSKLNAYVADEKSEDLFIAEYRLLRVFWFKDICLADERRKNDMVESDLKFLCGWINRIEKAM